MELQSQIFIHYFNPELLRAYGISNLQGKNKRLLQSSITTTKLAYILSELPLLIPASSIFESPNFKEFLESVKPLIDINFIKYVSPSADIESYAEKKIREFYNQPDLYPAYTDRGKFGDFIKLLEGINWQPRFKLSASKEISKLWKNQLEGNDGLWRKILLSENLKSGSITSLENQIYDVPEKLDGAAFVLYNTQRLIPFKLSDKNATQVNFLINRAFVESYIYEYEASIVTDSPIGQLDCGITNTQNRFLETISFSRMRDVLKGLGVDFILQENFSWTQLIDLKYDPYFEWFTKFLIENYSSDDFAEFKKNTLNAAFQNSKSKIIKSSKSPHEKAKAICILTNTLVTEKMKRPSFNVEARKPVKIFADQSQVEKKHVDLLFLADGWGSQYGGINTLNVELCKALAKIENFSVLCIVPFIAANYLIDEGVHVLGLYRKTNSKLFVEGWELLLMERLKEFGFSTARLSHCFGHDVITGNEAISLRRKFLNTKTAIISHQAFQLYTASKNNDGAYATKKSEEQLSVYAQADILFCIGPLLYDFFKGKDELFDMKNKNCIFELVPGIPNVRPSNAKPESFTILTMGRFEPENGDLKGIDLVIEGFASACKEAQPLFGDNPVMMLFGISNDKAINSQQSIDIIKRTAKIAETYISVNASPYSLDRSGLFGHIRNSSCVAMLSLQEGFGLVGWEAIACEIPLLVSENSGLYKLLKKKRLDTLVHSVKVNRNEKDIEKVKRELIYMAANIEKTKSNAIFLLSELKKDFTWDKVIRKLIQDIQSSVKHI